jgi:adenine-specific DNA-methyltransferase
MPRRATVQLVREPELLPDTLVARVEDARQAASRALDPIKRGELGQFLTPSPVARFMGRLFEKRDDTLHLLDAGAGVGSLTAAWVAAMCERATPPPSVKVTAFEIDPTLARRLRNTMVQCGELCAASGISFDSEVREEDFIEFAVSTLDTQLFSRSAWNCNCAILNPPYRKIGTDSAVRRLLERVGAGTTNLYAGFLGVAAQLLADDGEMVAITPRSFCNGPYFRTFRQEFLRMMALRRLHVFDARDAAFEDDEVLQENVIFRAVKTTVPRTSVAVSASHGPSDLHVVEPRSVPYARIVHKDDPELFIHVPTDRSADRVAAKIRSLPNSLTALGLAVSTGRVVDFRAREYLRADPADGTVPLVYPTHFDEGFVSWPKKTKKPNALARTPETEALLVPSSVYVLVKRFSSKEERRRVVAAVFDPERVACEAVGFENHLNYFHANGKGLSKEIAAGLAAFLNSTVVDAYFRQFNGHTQVNAGDLRKLPYPDLLRLERLGRAVRKVKIDQDALDAIVDRTVFGR